MALKYCVENGIFDEEVHDIAYKKYLNMKKK